VCTHFPGPFRARVVRLRACCRVKGGRLWEHFPGPFRAGFVQVRAFFWVKGGRLWGTSPALFGRGCSGKGVLQRERTIWFYWPGFTHLLKNSLFIIIFCVEYCCVIE